MSEALAAVWLGRSEDAAPGLPDATGGAWGRERGKGSPLTGCLPTLHWHSPGPWPPGRWTPHPPGTLPGP